MKVMRFLPLVFAACLMIPYASADLDRPSSDITIGSGSFTTTNSFFDVFTEISWQVSSPFQISLLGEVPGPPGNPEWEFNHYNGAGTWNWTNHNFADYPHYWLTVDTRYNGNVPVSRYLAGPTGEKLDWTLSYTDTSGGIQTVLGGDLQVSLAVDGTLSAFFLVTPATMYRTFEDEFANYVEHFNSQLKPTDIVGYQLTASGIVVGGDTWTSTGPMTLQVQAVPLPGSLVLCGIGVAFAATARQLRRRK